jgi:RNA polymerase sigma-70 factor (ECF subfamily)
VADSSVQLARDLLDGKPEAFDRFVDSFGGKVFQYSYLMCGQREDAEDVAQETLMSVFRNFDRLRDPERVNTWVFRIAKNACLMKRRRSQHAPQRLLSIDEVTVSSEVPGSTLQIPDRSAVPDDQLVRGEIHDALRAAIAGLPEIYKSVILLRDVEELSTQETADILEVSEDVVKQRLRRARLAVRRKLEAFGVGFNVGR